MASDADKLKEAQAKEAAAIARAEKAEAEAERLRKQHEQAASGSGFSFGDIGSWIGTLFTGALWLAGIGALYYGLREYGQGFLGSIFGDDNVKKFFTWADGLIAGIKAKMGGDVAEYMIKETPDEVMKLLSEQTGVSVDALKPFLGTKEKKDAWVNHLKAANGGELKAEHFTSANSIHAMLTAPQYAPMVLAIAKAALSKKAADGTLDPKAAKFIEMLKGLTQEERLNDLFNAQNKANTFALLEALAPNEAAAVRIKAMVEGGLDASGKATPALRATLATLLTLKNGKLMDEKETMQAVTGLAQTDPNVALKLVNEFYASTEGQAFKNNNNGDAHKAMTSAAGGEAALNKLLIELKGFEKNSLAQMQFALANRKVFDAYNAHANLPELGQKAPELAGPLGLLKSIPVDATPAVLRIMALEVDPRPLFDQVIKDGAPLPTPVLINTLLGNKELRTAIMKAEPKNVVEVARIYAKVKNIPLPDTFTAENLAAVVKAADAIGGTLKQHTSDEAMKTLNAAQVATARKNNAENTKTLAAVHHFANALITKDMREVTREDVASLLGDPVKSAAISTLLNEVSKDLPAAQKEVIVALLKENNWETITKLAGDPAGKGTELVHERLQGMFKPVTAESCKNPGALTPLGGFGLSASGLFSIFNSDYKVTAENADGIRKLAHDVGVAGCTGFIPPPRATYAAPTGIQVAP